MRSIARLFEIGNLSSLTLCTILVRYTHRNMQTSTVTFTRERTIRFSDCDPAGIVFYPQYFVMFNGLVEDWFTEGLNISYQQMIMTRQIGLPMVHLEASFRAISKMGDKVLLQLKVEKLGGKSMRLLMQCVSAVDGQLRMEATSLVTHQAIDIPADFRAAITGLGFADSAP